MIPIFPTAARRLCRSPLRALPLLVLGACADGPPRGSADALSCDHGDADITLPAGFCAVEVADDLGAARHLAVRSDGVLFVAIRNGRGKTGDGALMGLRDTDGDGVMDERERFGENGGTGIELVGDTLLYFGADDAVLRYRIPAGSLVPSGPPDTIVAGLPATENHIPKSIVVRGDRLYVNIGAPSNSCQRDNRVAGSPGLDPCPELETRAGIWVFDANRLRQGPALGVRFATGIRNMVAQTMGPDGVLYGVQHGRDQLGDNWGMSDQQNAELPAEEMYRIEEGDDFGWPYCYFDGELGQRVLAPEYGGDGREVGRCADYETPIATFPAHWAPNDMVFYDGAMFPAEYRGGAFIAFHGSWNRAPQSQAGYNVVFVPFASGEPAPWRVFADGFAGGVRGLPGSADHRPTGLALGPDGSLYLSDDAGGSIFRIIHAPGAE